MFAQLTTVLRWMIGHIEGLCESTNPDRFTCAGSKVVYNGEPRSYTLDPALTPQRASSGAQSARSACSSTARFTAG